MSNCHGYFNISHQYAFNDPESSQNAYRKRTIQFIQSTYRFCASLPKPYAAPRREPRRGPIWNMATQCWFDRRSLESDKEKESSDYFAHQHYINIGWSISGGAIRVAVAPSCMDSLEQGWYKTGVQAREDMAIRLNASQRLIGIVSSITALQFCDP